MCSAAMSAGAASRLRPARSTPGMRKSTYVKNPPYFEGMTMTPAAVGDIKGARALAVLGDSVTTDHISPAGNISKSSPAAKYLMAQGVKRRRLQLLRSAARQPRGDDARHVREHPPAQSAAAGHRRRRDGAHPERRADVDLRCRHEIQDRRNAAGDSRRQGIRHRQLARLGGQGHHAARRASGHRRELRAHPPLESHRHGRAAAAVQGGRERARLSSSPARRRSTSSGSIGGAAKTVTVVARGEGGKTREFQARLRIDTPKELDYYRHGGILHYVLRQLAASKKAA